MKRNSVIALLAILGFALLGAGAFRATLTPYTSFAQARVSRTPVQIIGSLDPGQMVEFDAGTGRLSFALTAEDGDTIAVLYTGSKPGNFEHATEVAAIGKYSDGYFLAQQLLVKCPSKYESKGED